MNTRQRLELTWIGKGATVKPEPRILIEDRTRSFSHGSKMGGTSDNILIHGDNLLALKALEGSFLNSIKCIYIDPPFNTGQAFDHYEDGVEHSLWLSLMTERIRILRNLLKEDGTIWVHLDDNEVHYLRVAMDEIFGRNCFVSTVIWRAADSSNHDAKQFSVDHNVILVYSKSPGWLSQALPRNEESNKHYSNPDNDPRGPWFQGNLSSPNPRENLKYSIRSPEGKSIKPPANGWRWSKERMEEMIDTGEVVFKDNGTRIMRKTYLADQKGLAPSSLWGDIEDTGHNRQAKYELKKLFPEQETADLFKTPKPERLIRKVLQIATSEGDIVLDSFLGSGTTAAVAHKMKRRWIGVELGDHCNSVVAPRMKKVITGEDKGGITNEVGWEMGGGYKFYLIGPSLISRDEWGRDVIAPAYRQNSAMLIEAMCKLHGYTFNPSESHFWLHGQSTERDFIYVTTQSMTKDQVAAISDEVGPERTLLLCCGSHRLNDPQQFSNITVEKIPKSVLEKCEWGKDDYSLKIRNLPVAEEVPEVIPEAERAEAAAEAPKRKRGRPHKPAKSDPGQASLFDAADATETK